MPTLPKDYTISREDLFITAIDNFASIRFRNSSDIHDFIRHYTKYPDFYSWFNEQCAAAGYFGKGVFFNETKLKNGVRVPRERGAKGPLNKADCKNFDLFWDTAIPYLPNQDPTPEGINLLQFFGLFSIIMNEASGFQPVSEYGDLAYMFMYNDDPHNKSAAWLFSNSDFKEAHSGLEFYDDVTADTEEEVSDVWKRTRYPAKGNSNPDGFPIDPAEGGIICQADFYKFRGRGLVQHTHRSVYKGIIADILDYTGTNKKILEYKKIWEEEWNRDLDKIATRSSNEDWDDLFMNTDLEVACIALRKFKSSLGFMIVPMDQAEKVYGEDRGSVKWIAKLVAGMNSDIYHRIFEGRVLQLIETLLINTVEKQNSEEG